MINVIVVGNRTLIQEGVTSVLSSVHDISIKGFADSVISILDLLAKSDVHVVIMDHHFLQNFDINKADKRDEIFGDSRLLLISDNYHKNEIQELIASGINNHVSNECSRAELIEAVFTTARSEKFLCSHIKLVLNENKILSKEIENIPSLSDRETEIIQLISIGLSNKEIAEKLFLSFHTIKTHRKNIIKKLGFTFKNASELALVISYLNDIII